jgi:hypothetical protein
VISDILLFGMVFDDNLAEAHINLINTGQPWPLLTLPLAEFNFTNYFQEPAIRALAILSLPQ